jgi:hypothetical protein
MAARDRGERDRTNLIKTRARAGAEGREGRLGGWEETVVVGAVRRGEVGNGRSDAGEGEAARAGAMWKTTYPGRSSVTRRERSLLVGPQPAGGPQNLGPRWLCYGLLITASPTPRPKTRLIWSDFIRLNRVANKNLVMVRPTKLVPPTT